MSGKKCAIPRVTSFKAFLRPLIYQSTVEADFAKDACFDRKFPAYSVKYRKQDIHVYHDDILAYLRKMLATDLAVQTFEKLWTHYIALYWSTACRTNG